LCCFISSRIQASPVSWFWKLFTHSSSNNTSLEKGGVRPPHPH
jgi:hypothetical protein